MASRVYLELNLREERKINFLQPRHRSSSKTDTKISKTFSTTPKDSEIQQNLPLKQARKYFEIRRISYQSIRKKQNKTDLPLTIPRPLSNKSERNRSISPKKLTIKRLNSTKNQFFEDPDPLPSTASKTYYNERLAWHKRRDKTLPLCLINFNGVLGDYYKPNPSDSENKFVLIEGVKPGLRLLSSEFFVAILSWYPRETTRRLLKFLDEQEIEYDALYIVRHRKIKYRFRHNYSQILDDFQVKDSFNETLLVTSLVINREEMIERRGADLFYEESLSGGNRFTSFGMPPVCEDSQVNPLCVLVPHFRLSEERISMLELAKFVLGVKGKCSGQIEDAEFDGQVRLLCEHQEIPVIPKKPCVELAKFVLGVKGKYNAQIEDEEFDGQIGALCEHQAVQEIPKRLCVECGVRYLVYTFFRSRKHRPPVMRKSSKFK